MKKIRFTLFFVLVVIIVSMFFSCKPKGLDGTVTPSTTESTLKPTIPRVTYDGEARLVVEDKEYKIILPELEAKLGFREEYEKYLPYITDELLIKSEKALLKNIGANRDSAAIYLSKDNEGYLCLSSEVIAKIDPPNVKLGDGVLIYEGCNIDHKHVFFRERISTESLK